MMQISFDAITSLIGLLNEYSKGYSLLLNENMQLKRKLAEMEAERGSDNASVT